MDHQNMWSQGKNLLKELLRDRSAFILVSVPVLLTAYKYYGSQGFFSRYLARFFEAGDLISLYSTLYSFLCCTFALMVVPAIFIKVLLKMGPRQFGLQYGDKAAGIRAVGIFLPIIALVLLLPASRQPAFLAEYPLFRHAGNSLSIFVLYEMAYGLYYLGWEFFFRGYMLFGLRDCFGNTNSILIQTIPSTLMHIGKPGGEIFAAILAGFLFGAIALRTRSIVYVFLLHWFIGIILDILIIYL